MGSGTFAPTDILRRLSHDYINKFSQAINQRVFDSLYSWFFSELCFDNYTLDFDSTVMERCGEQEGAAVGYNPKRPGRKSHHPLLAFVADLRMIANYWLRPGNTSASTNYLAFLDNTLDRLQGKKVGLVRMDSGFFSGEIFDRLEEKRLSYIVACRFNNSIKIQLASQAKWTEVADGIHIAESAYQAQDWKKPRRIIMVRQEIDKRPKAAGKKIKKIKLPKQMELFPDVAELGDYRYSCFITSLTLPAKCDSFIIMAYNFISLFRHAIINSKKSHFLKTIRYKILSIPAYLEKKGDKNILRLVRTINQRQAFLGLWRTTENFDITRTNWA